MTRSMLYAFDGTWNDDSNPAAWTHVYRLATCLYRERARYYPGVGSWSDTRGSLVQRLLGGAFANGLAEIIRNAFTDWLRDRENGVTTVDVIGFSRGAMAAIDFAGKIREYERDKRVPVAKRAKLRFIGLFDTVDAIGLPSIDWDPFYYHALPTGKNAFTHAVHAVALHETRTIFQVVDVPGMDLVMGFIGDHSDIGGGWQHQGLSSTVLKWMYDQAESAGIAWDRSLNHVGGKPDDRLLPHRVQAALFTHQPRTWPRNLTVYPDYPHWSQISVDALPYYPLLKQVPDHPRYRLASKQPIPQEPAMRWIFTEADRYTKE